MIDIKNKSEYMLCVINNQKGEKMALSLVIPEADIEIVLNGLAVGACEYTKMANTTEYPKDIRVVWRKMAGNISRVMATLLKEVGDVK